MKLPSPRATLAGCVWLPRLLAKARALATGALPPEYADRFCHPSGVDGQFLSYFKLTRDDVVALAARPDADAARWFVTRFPAEVIEGWNDLGLNLGRPGYPMAERLPVALATAYKHVNSQGITSVFQVLEADEQDAPSA